MCRLASKRGDRSSPPCSRSPWGLPGCMARPRPARLGGWPCGWTRLPVSVGPLHQPDQVLGPSRPTPSSPSPRPTASPSGGTLKEQIIHGRITATSRSCGTPSATSSNSTMPSGSAKRWLPEPRSSSSGVAQPRSHRDQARRVRQTVCPRNRVRYKSAGYPTSANRKYGVALASFARKTEFGCTKLHVAPFQARRAPFLVEIAKAETYILSPAARSKSRIFRPWAGNRLCDDRRRRLFRRIVGDRRSAALGRGHRVR